MSPDYMWQEAGTSGLMGSTEGPRSNVLRDRGAARGSEGQH